MACISKATFGHPQSRRVIKHAMPEFGDGVYVNVRALTAPDLLDLQEKYGGGSNNLEFAYSVLALALVSDDGEPIFESAADARANAHVSLDGLGQLVDVALATSGIKTAEGDEKN